MLLFTRKSGPDIKYKNQAMRYSSPKLEKLFPQVENLFPEIKKSFISAKFKSASYLWANPALLEPWHSYKEGFIAEMQSSPHRIQIKCSFSKCLAFFSASRRANVATNRIVVSAVAD